MTGGKIHAPDGSEGVIPGLDEDEKDGPIPAIRAGVPALPGEETREDHPARLPEDVEDRFTVR